MTSEAAVRAKRRKQSARGGRSGPAAHDRAAQIMDVALDLFSTRDYTSVTMNQIADVIGIRHSLIYYYFESKEELFNRTVEGHIAQTLEDYRALAGETRDPVEAIENWFDVNVRLAAPLRKLVKMMFDYSSPRGQPRSVSDAVTEFYRIERGIIAAGIADGIEAGMFRPVDPERIAWFVSTHIDGIFFSSIMRADVDLRAGMAELKQNLWLVLGYEGSARI